MREGPRGALDREAVARAAAGRTLIVAEDDRAVRSLLCRFLEAEGYRVLEAPTPEEALQLAAGADRVDGLVTDLLMPQMNGRELAHRLRQARAGLPVLFVSASANPELLAGDPEPGSAFLAKPFDRGSLSRAVRRVLDPD